MAGNALIQLPNVGVAAAVAPYRRSERHHRAHPLRLGPGDLARIQPAQAPADQQHRLVMATLVDRALQPFERVETSAPVHPLPPGMNAETSPGERAPELH